MIVLVFYVYFSSDRRCLYVKRKRKKSGRDSSLDKITVIEIVGVRDREVREIEREKLRGWKNESALSR